MKSLSVVFLCLLTACVHSKPLDLKGERGPQGVLSNYASQIKTQFAPQELSSLCKKAIEEAWSQVEEIIEKGQGAGTLSFSDTYGAMDLLLYDLARKVESLKFMSNVHPSQAVREEAIQCRELVSQFNSSLYERKDLYAVLKDVVSQNPIDKKLGSKIKSRFQKREDLLGEEQLSIYKRLLAEINSLKNRFTQNLNSSNLSLAFSHKQLEGVSGDFLSKLEKSSDGYQVAVNKENHHQILGYAKNPETRQKMHQKYYQRGGAENIQILEETLVKRQELAQLMGRKNWMDYKTKGRMAKDAKAVQRFYESITPAVLERNKKDIARLLEEKRREEPHSQEITPWDVEYYSNKIKARDYSLDMEEIRSYFPLDTVLKGLMSVYASLFQIEFEEVFKTEVWHPDVRLFSIKENGEIIAQVYLDSFSRVGKFTGSAATNLVKGRREGGQYVAPISVITANLTSPTSTQPSLLSHSEVETLFHEFGHVMHHALTRVPYGSLSGTSVVKDFVETPSQVLQEWIWDEEVLKKISGHYKNPKKPLPDSLIKKMISARDFNLGRYYARQIYLGMLDLSLHTQKGSVDTLKIHRDLYQRILGMTPDDQDLFPATFGHIMRSYDGGYYGYLWSKSYAMDVVGEFKKVGFLNADLGGKFRDQILAQGGVESATKLLENFLGRKPQPKLLEIEN